MTITVGGRVLRYSTYGPADGFPVIAHNGTPSTRLRRPGQIEAMLSAITVPVALWYGTHDQNIPAEHAEWLLANIPGAQGHQYDGGHVPGPQTFVEIYGWLRGGKTLG